MKRIILALAASALLIITFAHAQGTMLGLSADDYALLSGVNATALERFAFDYAANLSVDDLDTFSARVALTGSGIVDRSAPALEMSARGTVQVGTAQFVTLETAFRWVDDTLYRNPGDAWQARADAAAVAADIISQYAGLGADPAALAGWDLTAVEGLNEIIAALTGVDPAVFLSAQRLDDESIGGTPTAHFQISADLYALMQTDAFVDAVAAFASAQGNNLIIYDPVELGEIVRANSILFENTALTVDQYVGLDDGLLHRVALDLDMPFEPTVLGYDDAPFTLTAALDVTLRDHNQPQNIAAPDDAQRVTIFTMPPPAPEANGSGSRQYVYFETIGEGDTYTNTFDAFPGDVVTITVRGLGLEFDPLLQLLAPGGDVLAENDDHETAAFGVGDYDSQIVDFAISEAGTYSLAVTELSGGAGSFVLTFRIAR